MAAAAAAAPAQVPRTWEQLQQRIRSRVTRSMDDFLDRYTQPMLAHINRNGRRDVENPNYLARMLVAEQVVRFMFFQAANDADGLENETISAAQRIRILRDLVNLISEAVETVRSSLPETNNDDEPNAGVMDLGEPLNPLPIPLGNCLGNSPGISLNNSVNLCNRCITCGKLKKP